MTNTGSVERFFPKGLLELEWVRFSAKGFTHPVSGVIYRTAHPTCCGMPLGGVGTGCIDIETSGVLGFSTILDQMSEQSLPIVGPMSPKGLVYRHAQILLPFLGLSVREWAGSKETKCKTWIFTARKFIEGGRIEGCVEPRFILKADRHKHPAVLQDWYDAWTVNVPKIDMVEPAKEIDYWGHYPIADLEFDTDAPIKVGMRAWSPFIPGDISDSNIPGTVFEVSVRNKTDVVQCGTLAFSFPGLSNSDCGDCSRKIIDQNFLKGLSVTAVNKNTGYLLGVITEDVKGSEHRTIIEGTYNTSRVRFGAGLHKESSAWSNIASGLPLQFDKESGSAQVSNDGSASLAVDFILQPKQTSTIRIVLAWYAPEWTGMGYEPLLCFEPRDIVGDIEYEIPGRDTKEGVQYTAMYALHFKDAVEAADYLAKNHISLLKRILAWQEVIYTDDKLPDWLQDCLINHLALIPENSFWAQPKESIGDWSFPEGAFGLMECPRFCPITGCIGSNFYGDLPILYFFPELEEMILRNYREYLREDGTIPFLFAYADFTKPTYEWIKPFNGFYYADLVDRLWKRNRDDDILMEFYPSVKKSTMFTMTMVPGPEGIISVPGEGTGQLPWEHTPVKGMVPVLGGFRLCHLQIVKEMAEKMGDREFVGQCQRWFNQAKDEIDEKLWAGDSYLFYYHPKTKDKNDDVLSAQLGGEWASISHGFSGVFSTDRVKITLETIRQTCLTDYGLVGFASRKGGPNLKGYGTFYPENIITAMTYMYHGQKDFGLDILQRFVNNVVCRQGHTWDTPNLIMCDTGERSYGTDYFQNMLLWAVPSALEGKDLFTPCANGGLIARIIKAGADTEIEK